jgi:hypothetical protein
MIEFVNFLWTEFFKLTGWQMVLWIIYLLYFIFRTYDFWCESTEYGVIKGYKKSIFGHDEYARLYHIIRIIFDLPMAIIGLFLPLLRDTLTLKVCKLNKENK